MFVITDFTKTGKRDFELGAVGQLAPPPVATEFAGSSARLRPGREIKRTRDSTDAG
jgi:hypothetical protein